MSSAAASSPLSERYAAESLIQREFEKSGDAMTALRQRTRLVDTIIIQLYRDLLCSDATAAEKVCLLAVGGYGRSLLFPYSDVDVLLLCENQDTVARHREGASAICRSLWDLRMRVSWATRALPECESVRDDNPEFAISLLDSRYIAGDERLFARLQSEVIPRLVGRERPALVRSLMSLTRQRHARYGNTIFHLEPNLKDSPGGLRDYHVTAWLKLIAVLDGQKRGTAPQQLWPAVQEQQCAAALQFLSAARCFLHYRQRRDDNILSYELQAEAASARIGLPPGPVTSPADWMRAYFRHARAIYGLTVQILDEVRPARSSLYEQFERWRSRLSNLDFAVMHERVFVHQPADLKDSALLLRLFEFVARHGLTLSSQAERAVQGVLPCLREALPHCRDLWPGLRQILVLPHAADALRMMHRLELLAIILPEFAAIDSLVVRDFYHRYTVDEHSFMAITHVHRLRRPQVEWERGYSEILREVDQPELLFLALLVHDVGKGMGESDHIQGSLRALEAIASRWKLSPAECDTLRFLIANHLEMSAILLRRDISEPETIRSFAETTGTLERLKMLCLLTYADIRAVNPEALTAWKAEALRQLYMRTANQLNRSVDDQRFHAGASEAAALESILPFTVGATAASVGAFLEGFPRRYLLANTHPEIASHYELSRRLATEPVQLKLARRRDAYELTVITTDRPRLFATLTGTLAAWGMNILKAEAYANSTRIVVDTFRFSDPFHTLDLNPSELRRFRASIVEVLAGEASLDYLMQGRSLDSPGFVKVTIALQMHFDNTCSSHSTVLELLAQDRAGLLYDISSVLAAEGCDIAVALVDTEGQRAFDVFFLTINGAKLEEKHIQRVRTALAERLQ